jgi:extracellular elastinolytic metalloproteinase
MQKLIVNYHSKNTIIGLTFFLFCLPLLILGQESNSSYLAKKYPALKGNIRVSSQHMSKTSKVIHTYYVQTLNGLDIINAVYSLHTQSGKIIKENDQLNTRFFNSTESALPTISVSRAISAYALDKEITLKEKTTFEDGDDRTIKSKVVNRSISPEPIQCQLAYVIFNSKLRLIYRLGIWRDENLSDNWIDAHTGDLINEVSKTIVCNFDHGAEQSHNCYKNFEQSYLQDNSKLESVMTERYNVFPLGVESPIHGSRIMVTNPSDANASPYGWHDTNGVFGPEYMITRGNNVYAKEDKSNDNELTIGAAPDGGVSLNFDFPYNNTISLDSALKATTTNLFYWNNILHDITYQYGFDEVAGNFQINNYGKGGLGNDGVFADDLDGGGTNNANFSTPDDGSAPRMQMFRWTSGGILNTTNPNGSYQSSAALFGPSIYNHTATLAIASPANGCSTISNNVAGKIAIIDRGTCNFSEKVYNAQLAGATGVIIVQNTGDAPFAMSVGINGTLVTIPSRMISLADGNTVKNGLGVNPGITATLVSSSASSSIDNGVVAHEYGHGLSNRLTGGAANSDCLINGEQMGEGWSDWLGLVLTMKASDQSTKPRGVGAFLSGQDTLGSGIRTYRYTTDMTINPFTYANVSNSTSVHFIGSIWATMLWDLTRNLVDKYGFSNDFYYGNGGNNISISLVIEAMKLQPCYPGFVDGRDAILLADQLLYGGQNECLIWKTFARRGLGYSADQGSSNFNNDGIAAFDLPPTCNDLVMKLSTDRIATAINDSLVYTIHVKNIGTSVISNIVVKDTISSSYQILHVSNGGSFIDTTISYPSFSLNPGDSIIRTFIVRLINNNIAIPLVNNGAESSDPNNFIAKNNTTKFTSWQKSSSSPLFGTSHWFAKDDTSNVEKYLTIATPILPTDSSKLSFWHKFNTEASYDGGQIQYSFDKIEWLNLGSRMIQGAYNSVIDNDPGQAAFSGSNLSYMQTIINLADFANRPIYIRFRMHCDPFEGGDGWYIDDINFTHLRPSAKNVICQTNTSTASTCLNNSTLVRIVPCTEVYRHLDIGQGTLRKAIDCSNDGDTIKAVEGIALDDFSIQGTSIIINKNISIVNFDDIGIINGNLTDYIFIVEPNKNVLFQNLHIINSGSGKNTILNKGNLRVKNMTVE